MRNGSVVCDCWGLILDAVRLSSLILYVTVGILSEYVQMVSSRELPIIKSQHLYMSTIYL